MSGPPEDGGAAPGGTSAGASYGITATPVLDRHYRILREIGRGGMGVVYLGEDVMLRRRVAIKVLTLGVADDDADAVERFNREAVALAAIRHPNIVPIHAMGVDADGRPYIVMEYVPGETLEAQRKRLLASGERLPLDRACEIILGLTSGLAAAHDAGIVHRDVSAANVILSARDGTPVLTDFGLVRASNASPSRMVAGTPRYVAPELIRGQVLLPSQSHLPDLYALGALSYEIVTGQPVFEAHDVVELLRMHRDAVPAPPSSRRPDLPRAFDRIILQMLAKDPLRRPAHCGEYEALVRACSVFIPPSGLRARRRVPAVVAIGDDELAVRMANVVIRTLPDEDLAFEQAPDGNVAWDLIRARPPRLAIVGTDLAGLNVLELVAAIRGLKTTFHTPMIVVTTRPLGRADQLLLERFGARTFVAGSASDGEIATAARRALGRPTPGPGRRG